MRQSRPVLLTYLTVACLALVHVVSPALHHASHLALEPACSGAHSPVDTDTAVWTSSDLEPTNPETQDCDLCAVGAKNLSLRSDSLEHAQHAVDVDAKRPVANPLLSAAHLAVPTLRGPPATCPTA